MNALAYILLVVLVAAVVMLFRQVRKINERLRRIDAPVVNNPPVQIGEFDSTVIDDIVRRSMDNHMQRYHRR